jgi:mannose-6-phosphate isomerase class I
MGTHHLVPSLIYGTKKTLDMLDEDECPLPFQSPVDSCYRLPFLFKVLSIEKAVCIQAHPDQKAAIELHAKDEILYPG